MIPTVNILNFEPFPCTACGKCCRQVHKSEQTAFLDRGDGICRHFDLKTNLCQIYDSRPLVCRVEDYYHTYLYDKLSWQEFVLLNLEVCRGLDS